jgi:outer membrane protein insertion porin family
MTRTGKALFYILACFIGNSLFAQSSEDSLIDYSYPEKYELSGIRVVSDGTVDPGVIISISGLQVGSNITIPGDDISKAIQNLWKQKLFSDIKIKLDSSNTTTKKVWVSIHLKTRPRLARYTFTGINKGQAKKLKEEIKIEANDIVTDAMLSRVVRDVKFFYTEKGYPSAKVRIEAEPNPSRGNNMVDLKIHIDRGSRTRIDEIVFEGNTQLKEKKLQKQMKNTKEYTWWNILRTSKFKTEEYEKDKEAVIAYYRRNGYKDVHIVTDSTWMAEANRMKILIKIDEGNKYYFRDITWAGNTKYKSTDLNRVLNIRKGAVYNQELLDRNLYISETGADITSLYMDDGYLFFSVTPVEVLVGK